MPTVFLRVEAMGHIHKILTIFLLLAVTERGNGNPSPSTNWINNWIRDNNCESKKIEIRDGFAKYFEKSVICEPGVTSFTYVEECPELCWDPVKAEKLDWRYKVLPIRSEIKIDGHEIEVIKSCTCSGVLNKLGSAANKMNNVVTCSSNMLDDVKSNHTGSIKIIPKSGHTIDWYTNVVAVCLRHHHVG
ncbi:uncharacterized protein LOC120347942 [Styela clava]